MDAVMDMEPAICAATKAESIENTDVITMRNINKSYRMGTQSLHVLKDVSLTVKQGEYLAILGPSGSGKSTLMNIIGCMDVMDSGNYLLDGVAIEQAKEKELGVKSETLQTYGAVSEKTAKEMAIGCAAHAKAQVGISTTGIAGPGGGTAEKPVGLVYIGCAVRSNVYVEKNVFSGDRQQVRRQAADRAIGFALECIKKESV